PLLAEHAPRVLVEPVATNVGVVPASGLLKVSLSVIVTVDFVAPSATTGLVALMLALPTALGVNVTVPPVTATGAVSESVLLSALVDASVHDDTPTPLLAEQGPRMLLAPVAENAGTTFATGLLDASLSVTVTDAADTPS